MTFGRAARLTLALMLTGIAAAAGSAARESAGSGPAWVEVDWPFLLDQWGTGQAFACEQERCGPDTRLFVRVKRGFCNCFQGVADDAEVDRLSDFEFFGGDARPLGPGRVLALGEFAGRMRAFAVENAEAPARRAVSFVLAKECDALVATLISDPAGQVGSETDLMGLLQPVALANLP
jgi:hypothetical protein